jgi:hypothetical protein
VLAGSALGATVAALTPRLAGWRRTVAPDAVEGSAER